MTLMIAIVPTDVCILQSLIIIYLEQVHLMFICNVFRPDETCLTYLLYTAS